MQIKYKHLYYFYNKIGRSIILDMDLEYYLPEWIYICVVVFSFVAFYYLFNSFIVYHVCITLSQYNKKLNILSLFINLYLYYKVDTNSSYEK